MQTTSSPSMAKKLLKVVLYAALLALPVFVWFYRFNLYDWWRLRGYSPPAAVQEIADKTTMDSSARRMFYANHPIIEDGSSFSTDCQQNEFTIVLGCYIQGKGIFLYKVTDPRLNGVKEVTGAHEMLHAAYDRLSGQERKKVDQMIDDAFAKVTDQRVRETVEQYRKKDPGVVTNELHSILGTEVRNLPPGLEAYYEQYFDNRLAIVGFSEQYEAEFSSRQTKVKQYDTQLIAMKAEIDKNESELSAASSELKASRARLDSLRAAGDYESYNAGVSAFNAKVSAYNRLAASTSTIIEQYNTIVKERNALAGEVNDLAKAIDSRPQGISGQ